MLPTTIGLFLDAITFHGPALPAHAYLLAVTTCETSRTPEANVQVYPLSAEVAAAEPVEEGSARAVLELSSEMDVEVDLLEPTDPGRFIVSRVVVMASYKHPDRVGTRIDGARHLLAQTQLGRTSAAGIGSAGAAYVAVEEAAGLVIDMLVRDGDQVLFQNTVRIENDVDGQEPITLVNGARSFDITNGAATISFRVAADAADQPAADTKDEDQPAKIDETPTPPAQPAIPVKSQASAAVAPIPLVPAGAAAVGEPPAADGTAEPAAK